METKEKREKEIFTPKVTRLSRNFPFWGVHPLPPPPPFSACTEALSPLQEEEDGTVGAVPWGPPGSAPQGRTESLCAIQGQSEELLCYISYTHMK